MRWSRPSSGFMSSIGKQFKLIQKFEHGEHFTTEVESMTGRRPSGQYVFFVLLLVLYSLYQLGCLLLRIQILNTYTNKSNNSKHQNNIVKKRLDSQFPLHAQHCSPHKSDPGDASCISMPHPGSTVCIYITRFVLHDVCCRRWATRS